VHDGWKRRVHPLSHTADLTAEKRPYRKGAKSLFDALKYPKQFVRFLSADAGGTPCKMGNRSLLNQTVLGWIDETLRS
jgi:hypothetical protein